MPLPEVQLTEQFYRWEQRGRGWQLFPEPVSLEPPFRPFYTHSLSRQPYFDDGRSPSLFGSIFGNLCGNSTEILSPVADEPETEAEPTPISFSRDSLVELQLSLPTDADISREAFDHLLSNLAYCREPLAFELLGQRDEIVAQLAVHPKDAPTILRQLRASFPEVVCTHTEGGLKQAWDDIEAIETVMVEFGLGREFMLPLATCRNFNHDPLNGLAAALSELHPNELGLFQVLFQPVNYAWSESIVNAVSDGHGRPFFVNAPELWDGTKTKLERPLYAVIVRVAVRCEQWDRAWEIARDMAATLRVFAHPNGNEFIPLPNEGYDFDEHAEDVIRRQSHRSGMLLNRDELISLVHLPSSSVTSSKLRRKVQKSKAAPVYADSGLLLGYNDHAGQRNPVCLSPDQRVRHMHLVGASGTGKSTLLFNLIRQDLEMGNGLCLCDPHGDLIDKVLGIIPSHRIDDVVLVDPSDEEYAVGFNILSAHSDLEKNLLASDLVSVFQRLSSSWGDQMGSVLQNAISAFLESNQGGTLADLQRFLIDPAFRAGFLKSVRDPNVVFYWQKAFPQLGSNKSIGPILTRLEKLLAFKPIRNMVSQVENRLDFADIMDTGKIFLAKLPQGQIGKENSYLLGSLLVSKFQQMAMSRQRMAIANRRDFFLYLDEAHHFITPSMAEILTGTRKYRVGLVFAHHDLQQLQRDADVAGAIMSSAYTRVVFRVGESDAKKLSEGFAFFDAQDLQCLETGEAICRIERSDGDFNLSIPPSDEPDEEHAAAIRERVITSSRSKYAKSRDDLGAAALQRFEGVSVPDAIEPKPASVTSPPIEPPRTTETPKPAEVRKSEPSAQTPPKPAADMGIGGAQHQAMQQRIKREAEAFGFLATIEKTIPNGKVDLLLERGGVTIACEVSVTTTIDHEFRNITKCLKAGIDRVAAISGKPERLRQIEEAVKAALPAEAVARVAFYSPDEFIATLRTLTEKLAPSMPAPQKVSVVRGYKVKRDVVQLTPDELKGREAEHIRMLAEVMRQKGP